jgi:uncharacterized protein
MTSKPDWKQALDCYEKAVALGSNEAAVKLGLIYLCGMNVVIVDRKRAKMLFEQAHHAGIEEGTVWYAHCLSSYQFGKCEAEVLKLLEPLAAKHPFAAWFVSPYVKDETRQKEILAFAAKEMEALAVRGDPWAQNSFGCMCKEGKGVAQDCRKAIDYWLMSHAQGNSWAQSNLAEAFADWVDNRDLEKALQFSRLGADQGHPKSLHDLGRFYYSGIGVKQDIKQAMEWYHKAMNAGSVTAMCVLGQMYLVDGKWQDVDKAFELFLKAAEHGHEDAQHRLATCYEFGLGCSIDRSKAAYWYEKAANKNAQAMFNLGGLMRREHQYDKSFACYLSAAEKGYVEAQGAVGRALATGMGVAVDMKTAVQWMSRAVKAGSVWSQGDLGHCYKNGWCDLPKDEERAAGYFVHAARIGHIAARQQLQQLGVMDF